MISVWPVLRQAEWFMPDTRKRRMDLLPRHERPCEGSELEGLLLYLESEGDPMAGRVRSSKTRILMGRVFPTEQVGMLKHCWPTLPGPVENVPLGTGYIPVSQAQLFFSMNPIPEWADHENRIQGMLATLRQGRPLGGKVVLWHQLHPSPVQVIIVGNHTAAALYRYAVESQKLMSLEVFREERAIAPAR